MLKNVPIKKTNEVVKGTLEKKYKNLHPLLHWNIVKYRKTLNLMRIVIMIKLTEILTIVMKM